MFTPSILHGNTSVNHSVLRLDQRRIVRSIKEKCGLIDHLFRGGINWRVDAQRTDCNNETIEELLSSARHMLDLINDEYDYYDAANEIERTLLRMNRVKEASSLYV
jgi:hypothetical protein